MGGDAFAQTFFWTGDGAGPSFNNPANWQGGAAPTVNALLAFNADIATGANGMAMTLNQNFAANGLDVEGGVSAGDTIVINQSLVAAFTLTLNAYGITVNTTSNPNPSTLTINVPVELSTSQTWQIVGSDLTSNGAISQIIPGISLELLGTGTLNAFTLNSGASTFSGGLFLSGAATVLYLGASSTGPAGNPTSGPVGTGTLTLGNGTSLTLVTNAATTLANNITIGTPGITSTATIAGLGSGTLTLTGDISNAISGTGKIQDVGLGPINLEGNNTYSGGTLIANTTAIFGTNTAFGFGPVTGSAALINFNGANPTLTSPTFTGNSTVNFTVEGGDPTLNALTLTNSTLNIAVESYASIVDMVSDSPGSTNVINIGYEFSDPTTYVNLRVDSPTNYYGTIADGGSLIISGSPDGTLDLYGANTYSGGTSIAYFGVAVADNNTAFGSGPITVNNGAALGVASGITITNMLSLADGSAIEGYGTFATPTEVLTIENGSTLSGGKGSLAPASAVPVVGTLTFGANASLVFAGGGILQFSIMNAAGSVGTGYSTINAPGSNLNITATPGSPTTEFTIQLVSVSPSTMQQGVATFNTTLPYSWTLLSAGTITGFTGSDQFNIDDTTFFQNSVGGGTFSVSDVGNNLVLSFTPVPEPATWALMATGLCALCAAAWRRRSRPAHICN